MTVIVMLQQWCMKRCFTDLLRKHAHKRSPAFGLVRNSESGVLLAKHSAQFRVELFHDLRRVARLVMSHAQLRIENLFIDQLQHRVLVRRPAIEVATSAGARKHAGVSHDEAEPVQRGERIEDHRLPVQAHERADLLDGRMAFVAAVHARKQVHEHR